MLGHKLVVAKEGEEEVAFIHDEEAPLMVVGSPVGTNGVELHFIDRASTSKD